MRSSTYLFFIGLFIISCSTKQGKEDHQHEEKQSMQKKTANSIMLTDSQMKLANITTTKAGMQLIGQTKIINGKLVVNEERVEVISSRAKGRVEKLFIKETGRLIKAGEPLYELYSEELLTYQREYLLAQEQYAALGKNEKRYESFLKAAEKKLLLYGLTSKQVDQLGKTKAIQPRITFLSPASGIVTEINSVEGQYISEGSLLYRVENLNQLWIEAELYPEEAALLKTGDKVNATITGFEPEIQKATVIFLSPEYRANSQIISIRLLIDNIENKFKPGAQAQITFTYSAHKALAIPTDAIIRDSKGTHVYVLSEQNTFQPRRVETGVENFDQIEIKNGIKENETIAASGAYLLYSEFVLKNGLNPVSEHSH